MGFNTYDINLQELRKIMRDNNLSRKDIAKLANRSLQTVHQWFSRGKTSHKQLKDEVLERIIWKLGK